MKLYIKLLSLVAVMALSMTSCDKDNKDNPVITEQTFPSFYASVNDLSNGVSALYSNVSYLVYLNYSTMRAEVNISGLKLPDGTIYPTLKLTDIAWRIDSDQWKVISGKSLIPTVTGYDNLPMFSSFEMKIFERVLDNQGSAYYSPGVSVTYTLDSRYRVASANPQQLLYGSTESTSASGKKFETNVTEYITSFNVDTRTLKISMNNAKFEEGMPMSLNIDLSNIPVTFMGSQLHFDVDAITPSIGGTPFEAFPITDLKGYIDPATGLHFTFHCNPRTTVESYDVEVDCEFDDIPGEA